MTTRLNDVLEVGYGSNQIPSFDGWGEKLKSDYPEDTGIWIALDLKVKCPYHLDIRFGMLMEIPPLGKPIPESSSSEWETETETETETWHQSFNDIRSSSATWTLTEIHHPVGSSSSGLTAWETKIHHALSDIKHTSPADTLFTWN